MVTPMVQEIIPVSQPKRRRTAKPKVHVPAHEETYESQQSEYHGLTFDSPDMEAKEKWFAAMERNYC